MDIAIRMPKAEFDEFVRQRFGTPTPGSAKERAMLHAMESGKVNARQAGVSDVRDELAERLDGDVDLSVIEVGGPFDTGPYVALPD